MMNLLNFSLLILCYSFVGGEDTFELDGYKYLFSGPFTANWYNANQYCRYRGMYLVDVPTFSEQKRIVSLVKHLGSAYNNTCFLTSGSDLGEEGKFVWMSSGHPVIFSYWHTGQPDNMAFQDQTENCLALCYTDKLYWNDGNCMGKYNFICRNETIDPYRIDLRPLA